VPVDLNWTNRSEKKYSAPKAVTLLGIVLILGLLVVSLFKVQNLVYSASYINWRMQELESTLNDSNDDVKLIKYKMSMEDRDDKIAAARLAKAEPLIATIESLKNIEQRLDNPEWHLSSLDSHKLASNSLTSESTEKKNSKEVEVQSIKKLSDTATNNVKDPLPETKNKVSESSDLNDARDHPNPSDPEEWIKPLVETFDIFGNQPIEDHFIQNVLMKLLMPENNFEVLEFNKMHEAGNNADQESPNQNIVVNPINHNNKEKQIKPLPLPIENFFMKSLLPPASNFKIFHFNEKPQQHSQPIMDEELSPKIAFQNMKIKQLLPPIDGFIKTILPPNNMKVFQLNDKHEQNSDEESPKITIQSIKLKLLPLATQDDFPGRRDSPVNTNGNGNFEIIRLNDSSEPSQDVEAPKMPMPFPHFNPFPIPIQDILMKTILPSSKGIEFVPLNDKSEEQHMMSHRQQHQEEPNMDINQAERFNPLPIPIQSILMKTLLPPPNQNTDDQFNKESQDQSNSEIEVAKIPVRTMKVNSFPLPIPDALMKSMLPINNYGEPLINISDSLEDSDDQEQSQQQNSQPQPLPPMNQQQQIPTSQQSQQQLQQQSEVSRGITRSTKLNPVDESKDVTPSTEYPTESVEK
jgi:hypothetical protein